MFERSHDLTELGDAALLDAGAEFRAVADRAEVGFLQVALVFADRNHEPYRPTGGEIVAAVERIKVYGGDGCPGVAEFAPVEFGARYGMSAGAAAAFIGDALGLRHRLPRVFARVLAGQAPAWRARQIARACLSLSQAAAAAIVDAEVESMISTVSNYRLVLIVKAAVLRADPDQAGRNADEMKRSRGVWVGQSDAHGTRSVWVKAAAGDVARFDAIVQDLAEALGALGDTDSLDQRRAKAIGWLADPDATTDLRNQARQTRGASDGDGDGAAGPTPADEPDPDNRDDEPDPADLADLPDLDDVPGPDDRPTGRRRPTWPARTTAAGSTTGTTPTRPTPAPTTPAVAVGVATGPVAGLPPVVVRDWRSGWPTSRPGRAPPARTPSTCTSPTSPWPPATASSESTTSDPLLAGQLGELLGHDKIIVKPVIDLRDQISVDSYEIPARIRERTRLRYPVSMFPWSNHHTTTRTDLDHVVPYDDTGPPAQTSTENLAPLSRLQHRVKTHGGWNYRVLGNGAFEWTSRQGNRYRVDHTGTTYLGNHHTSAETPA